MYKYLKKNSNADHISAWESKRLSDESFKHPVTSDNSLAPSLSYVGTKTRVKFVGSYLKQDQIAFTPKKVVKNYIFYEINLWDCGYFDYPTLENYLFGAVKLVKNVDIDKYKYSGYGIGFNRRGTFSVDNGFRKNVTIFGVTMKLFYTC